MEVTLPDGTRVRACGLHERAEVSEGRDFGLYMDPGWAPTWPAELIDWPDFGVPSDGRRAAAQIRAAFARARSGQGVEIGCVGGVGRTGTVLACMAVLGGLGPDDAIGWVRANYRPRAVERPEQERWVAWFAAHAVDPELADEEADRRGEP